MGKQNITSKKHIDESDVFTRRMFIKGMATSFGALPVFAWPRWAQAFYYNLGFFKKGSASSLYVEDVFSTYLYTGAGGTQTITNSLDVRNSGGIVWIKPRTSNGGGSNDNQVFLPGTGAKRVRTNSTVGEDNQTASEFTANADGFSLANGDYNSSGVNFASWTFRKAAKFFDVVTYTGDGTSNRNIVHALGVAPGMIAIKRTNSISDWYVYHRGWGFPAEGGRLNGTDAFGSTYKALESADPTITTFTPAQTNANINGATYVAYLFAHDAAADGIIQCGSYTGSGGVDSVTLGWEPQFVLMKSTTAGQWSIEDVMRDMNHSGQKQIQPNSSGAELSQSAYVIPNATGFTVNSGYYGTGTKVVYVAIRRPMKTPTVGTQVFNSIARTGNAGDVEITGIGFSPDLVLVKPKTPNTGTNFFDRLCGANRFLDGTSTSVETTTAGATLKAFLQDGVSVGSDGYSAINQNSINYINYFFRRAPGFFDQVCYTGDGTITPNINHSLGVRPNLVIIKRRDSADNWHVYHDMGNPSAAMNKVGSDAAGEIFLNTTAGIVYNGPGGANAYMDNATSTTFRTQNYAGGVVLNSTGAKYVAYLFASCPGVSKVGSYTGNGSSQTINCGFTNGARFILIKRTDAAGDWYVWDSARGISTTPPATGETVYTTPGTYNWIVPAGVTSVSVLCVGGGGGGGSPSAPTNGGDSSFGAFVVANGGGASGGAGSTIGGDIGGGDGGNKSWGGGGAGGYSGNGGNGGAGGGATAGAGGGGGGGYGNPGNYGDAGGGVGLYGQGANGAVNGGGGSGGANGSSGSSPGGDYGGGAGGNVNANGGAGGGLRYRNNISVTPGASISVVVGAGGTGAASGGKGAVRIMWGAGKSFPSAAGASTVYNVNDPHLSLNASSAEVTTDNSVDAASSGFIVIQDAATNINVNGATYIFLAIA